MDSIEVVELDAEVVADELAKKLAVAPVVEAKKPDEEVLCSGRYNLYDLLKLYELGRARVGKPNHERWIATFSAAVSTNGIWAVRKGGEFTALAVFWKTKNPHVDLKREVPKPLPDGNYAYVAWMWSDGEQARRLRRHIREAYPKVEFVAWHDQRSKRSKKDRSKLYVMELKAAEPPFVRMNGVAAHG